MTSTASMRARRRPPRAMLLDALGTLLALEPPAPRLCKQLAERFGIEVGEAQAQAAVSAEIGYYRAHLQEGRDPLTLAALRTRCAAVLRTALPASDVLLALSERALADALLASLQFTVFDDVVPALQRARERGEVLIVVSNWDVSLTGVLQEAGISQLLDGVLSSAAIGARKPARRIFEHALRVAGTSAEHAIHVGDSLEEDVAGALGIGIEPVLIRRDGSPGPSAVRTIRTLAQLG